MTADRRGVGHRRVGAAGTVTGGEYARVSDAALLRIHENVPFQIEITGYDDGEGGGREGGLDFHELVTDRTWSVTVMVTCDPTA